MRHYSQIICDVLDMKGTEVLNSAHMLASCLLDLSEGRYGRECRLVSKHFDERILSLFILEKGDSPQSLESAERKAVFILTEEDCVTESAARNIVSLFADGIRLHLGWKVDPPKHDDTPQDGPFLTSAKSTNESTVLSASASSIVHANEAISFYELSLISLADRKPSVILALQEFLGVEIGRAQTIAESVPTSFRSSRIDMLAALKLKLSEAGGSTSEIICTDQSDRSQKRVAVLSVSANCEKTELAFYFAHLMGSNVTEAEKLIESAPVKLSGINVNTIDKEAVERAGGSIIGIPFINLDFYHIVSVGLDRAAINYSDYLGSKFEAIKAVKALKKNIGAAEAKRIVESAPCEILSDVTLSKALQAVELLSSHGCACSLSFGKSSIAPAPTQRAAKSDGRDIRSLETAVAAPGGSVCEEDIPESPEAAERLGDFLYACDSRGSNLDKIIALYTHAAEAGREDAVEKLYQLGLECADAKYSWVEARALALSCFKPAAKAGHASAQYQLGKIYADTAWTEHDASIACDWYEKAAARGHAEAAYDLAECFLRGEGRTMDAQNAVRWYELAVDHGNAQSAIRLAGMYQEGVLIPRDTDRVIAWRKKAIELGDAQSKTLLADLLYAKGQYSEALRWYRASFDISPISQARASWMLATDKGEEQNPEEAVKLAAPISTQCSEAAATLAYCYYFGKGIEKDYKKAKHYAELGKEACLTEQKACSMSILGCIYFEDAGEYDRAFSYFKKASDLGNLHSKSMMARMLAHGQGCARSYSDARNLAEEVVNANNSLHNRHVLASILTIPDAFSGKDQKQGFDIFLQLVDEGCGEAFAGLMHCYMLGIGTKKSVLKAMKYSRLLSKYLNDKYGAEEADRRLAAIYNKA